MIIIIIEANGSDLVFVTVQKTSQVSLMQIKLTPSVTSVGLFVLLLGVWLLSGVSDVHFQMTLCVPPRHQEAIRKALDMTVPHMQVEGRKLDRGGWIQWELFLMLP